MKRYYIVPIINDPVLGYCPKTMRMGVVGSYIIPTNPDGTPKFDWCLGVIGGDKHAELAKDKDIDPLPDFPLDGKVSSIHTVTKNGMIQRLKARGIDTGFISTTDGYREVIRGVGRHLSADFDENSFDVSEA